MGPESEIDSSPSTLPTPTTLDLNKLPAKGTASQQAYEEVSQTIFDAQDKLDAYLAAHPDVYLVGDRYVRESDGGTDWTGAALPSKTTVDSGAMSLMRAVDTADRLRARVGELTKSGYYGAGGGAVEAYMTSSKNPDLKAYDQFADRATKTQNLRADERQYDIAGQTANINMGKATQSGVIAPGFDSYFGTMPADLRHSNELDPYTRDPTGMYDDLFGESPAMGYASGTDSSIPPEFAHMVGKPSVPMDPPMMKGIPWPGSYKGAAPLPGVK